MKALKVGFSQLDAWHVTTNSKNVKRNDNYSPHPLAKPSLVKNMSLLLFYFCLDIVKFAQCPVDIEFLIFELSIHASFQAF